jgi:hypothetical protein
MKNPNIKPLVPPQRLILFLIAAFCRLAKLLSHSEQMGWLVGAVGIEMTSKPIRLAPSVRCSHRHAPIGTNGTSVKPSRLRCAVQLMQSHNGNLSVWLGPERSTTRRLNGLAGVARFSQQRSSATKFQLARRPPRI